MSEFQCLDIDECSRGIHGCDPNSICINTPGSWRCQCNNGWYPEPKEASLPTCKDVNECVEDQNACPVQSLCINSAGSYRCDCLAGWRNQGLYACRDIDECSEGTYNCPSNSRCVNTAGSYQCHCNFGYEPPITTSTCQNINECTRGLYSCPSNAYCVDTDGSYTCHCLQCYYMSGNTCHSKCHSVAGVTSFLLSNSHVNVQFKPHPQQTFDLFRAPLMLLFALLLLPVLKLFQGTK